MVPVEWRGVLGSVVPSASNWVTFGELGATGGTRQLGWIVGLLLIVWLLPNSQSLVRSLGARTLRLCNESWLWATLGSFAFLAFLLAAINGSHAGSEFIYFNF